VGIKLLLQRPRVFLLVRAVTSGAGFEFHSGAGSAFGFYRDAAEPLGAAESGLFGWHGLRQKEYTASVLDLRQERLALLLRNASFIIAIAERE
jgi:hypothetical protein